MDRVCRVVAVMVAGLVATAAAVWGETTELVTYYPTSASTGDSHVKSLTVGTDYQNESPGDGVALISKQLGIGTVNPAAPAPNGQAGNLDVNDLWLRAGNAGAGRWLSQTPQIVSAALAADTTYTAPTEKTLVQVTITTRGGPLLIQGKAFLTAPGVVSNCQIRIRRGGLTGQIVDAWHWWTNASAGAGMTGVVMATESPAAGTYTYLLTGDTDTGPWGVKKTHTKLIVTEP
ncbi:MAG: hypothetical protein HYZ93_05030 [Candidatus Omnitrophica bacterium]|nr:hypothetical protein [Candidatus Omnitrophota bacterium]